MKKFLFTLAAMLMTTSAFATYMYVDPATDYEQMKGKGEQELAVKAHMDARVSAFDFTITYPQGVTATFCEAGADCAVAIKNARGRDAVANATLWGAAEPYDHMILTLGDNGYWQDPNGEDPTAWVAYGVAKWEAGDYDEMLLLYVVVDDTYAGGRISITASPSSGKDTRGGTVKDNGEEGQPQVAPWDVPGQEKIDVAAPVISTTMDATTVTVNIEWPTTDGEHMYNGQYTYERPAYGEAAQSYDVEAYTTETETYKESVHATYTVEVPAQDPVWQDVVAPVITPTVNATTVTVEITWPTSDGEKVYTGQYTYDRPAYGEADQTYQVEAYTTEKYPYRESAHATATINVPAQAPVWQAVAAPVITPTTGDDAVTVTIEWPTTTGNHVYNGEYSYARGEQDYTVTVEAYTEADYPYSESTHATLEITVPAKEQVTPPEPGETKTFVKVTAADQLVAGKNYIIVAGSKAMGVAATGNFLAPVDITAGDEVEVGDDVAIMTLGGTLNHYTLALGDQYLTAGNSTNLAFGATATEWAIADYNGTLDGYRVKHADYNRAVRYSSGYNRFGNYSTSDQNSEYAWIYVEKTETPALQDLTGKIVVSEPDENGVVTVTYTGEEDVTITVNGQPVAESYQLEDGVPMTFDVVVSAQGYNDLTASETRTWNKPVEKIDVAAPVISTETTATQVIVTIAWPTTDGEKVYTGQYTYDRPAYGEAAQSYDVEAYTKESDTYKESAHATETIVVPAQDPVWQDVVAPVITTTMDENNVYVHVAWPTSTGEQIFEGEYTYPRGDEDYSRTVVAYTTENYPYRESAHATYTVEVPKKVVTPPTSIEEILNSENVASVRYFNMAGQEMQEAEGMTIVVVTYTNGTTSAIKVMK